MGVLSTSWALAPSKTTQVGRAGHRHRAAGAVLDVELVDVVDVVLGHGPELEDHAVAGVAPGPDVDEGRGRAPAGAAAKARTTATRQLTTRVRTSCMTITFSGKLLARGSSAAVTARMRACIRAAALATRIGHGGCGTGVSRQAGFG